MSAQMESRKAELTRYVVATKRERRSAVPNAIDMLRPLIDVWIVEAVSRELVLIDSVRTIEEIRLAIGPDYHVEREITYELPETF